MTTALYSTLEARRNESVAAEGKTMIDDARLKAMKLVNDARQSADQALATVDSPSAKERLQALQVTLEEIEEDLKITELDHTLSELRSFQQRLHEYTITHAIEDRNVLRFHVDYYKPDGKGVGAPSATLTRRKIVDTILDKHDAATAGRRFNAILATASGSDGASAISSPMRSLSSCVYRSCLAYFHS